MTRFVLTLLAVSIAVAGCGSAAKPADTPTPAGPPAATITIDNFTFGSPPPVPAGATIAVRNADPAEHSVTADTDKAFNIDVDAGETVMFTAPAKPGSYPYHCAYHPMMHGVLVVR